MNRHRNVKIFNLAVLSSCFRKSGLLKGKLYLHIISNVQTHGIETPNSTAHRLKSEVVVVVGGKGSTQGEG
ncbi:unnamed protein product [Cuscuta epithymum]|uniref:Uncharacterized protein n=1 Tax=Cuscuta epithymum TaxID=186058 RepID=A0AAV0FHS2_9ASTE|nr:unnamed protein product [Cuscuta epithymum]